MVNTSLLKSKLKAKDLTQADVAKMLGIDTSTFNRKINNSEGDCITVKEVDQLTEILNIPKDELSGIFFA